MWHEWKINWENAALETDVMQSAGENGEHFTKQTSSISTCHQVPHGININYWSWYCVTHCQRLPFQPMNKTAS